MCFGIEAAWLPYVLSAAGAGVSAYGQKDALDKQDREVASGIRRNADFGRQGAQRVGQEIQKVASANPAGDQKAANSEFMAALKAAQVADGGGSFDTVGKTSGKFAEDVGAARGRAGAEGAATANVLSRIDAPARQRTREGVGFNNAATDLSMLASRAQGEDFLSQLRASQIRPKGQEVGSFLTGLGSTLATRAPPVKKPLPEVFATRPEQLNYFGGP